MRTLAKKVIASIKDDPSKWEHYNNLFAIAEEQLKGADKWWATERLKRLCVQGMQKVPSLQEKLSLLFKETLLLEAQGLRFDSYMQYIELGREPEKRFWLPRRKQLLHVVDAIQELIDGELDILCISLPPGIGKSTLGIFLLTMLMGAYPDKPNLASAHSGTLTNSFFTGVLQIIKDDAEYAWHEVFPECVDIFTDAKEQTIDLIKPRRFNSLTCRPIRGTLTGATRCEMLLYADDLVSGIEEAMSYERMEKLWIEYTTDLKTRKKLGCKELHVATRWSIHDPIGKLEQQYSDDPRVQFITVPALNELGESNFDYDHGVGFTTQYFIDMRNNLDEASWRSLFENSPIEREGVVYKADELRYYFDLPNKEPDVVLAVCDTKDKGKDYAFLPVVYVYGEDYYVEDCVCNNGLPDRVEAALVDILLRHGVNSCRFESNNAGGRIAEDVDSALRALGGITHITTKQTLTNKETRIIVNSKWVKEHCLFKSGNRYQRGSEYDVMMRFLLGYTLMGRNAHDDVPDGMAMLASFVQELQGSRVRVFDRLF